MKEKPMKSAEKIELIRNLMPPKPVGLDGKPKDYRSRHYQWIEDLLLIVKKQNIKIAELKRSQPRRSAKIPPRKSKGEKK